MNIFLRMAILIIVLVLYSCKDKINNPVEGSEKLYKVEGFITNDGLPLPSVNITLDTLVCISDSTGYFLFNSIKSGHSRIIISHPEFNIIDSLINIDKDLTLSFDLQYRLYKVEGFITHNGLTVPSVDIRLDSLICISDSSGYFLFDSLRSGQAEIVISHPQYITVDTLININKDLIFSFGLQYKSESFLPLKTGNKWYYNPRPDHSAYEFLMEVEGTEEIEGLNYYKILCTEDYGFNQYYWYLRIDNDSLYSIRCNETGLLAPFNAEPDSVFFIHYCDTDYNAYIYEKSVDKLKFGYWAILALDADFALEFQKGIGIIHYGIDGWYNYVLDHYEIY